MRCKIFVAEPYNAERKINEWLESQKTPITIDHVTSTPYSTTSIHAILIIFYSTRKDKLERLNEE